MWERLLRLVLVVLWYIVIYSLGFIVLAGTLMKIAWVDGWLVDSIRIPKVLAYFTVLIIFLTSQVIIGLSVGIVWFVVRDSWFKEPIDRLMRWINEDAGIKDL